MARLISIEFDVGDEVYDDLTSDARNGILNKVKIIGLRYENGRFDPEHDNVTHHHSIGYRVDNDWLDGLRHPWELTAIESQGENNG